MGIPLGSQPVHFDPEGIALPLYPGDQFEERSVLAVADPVDQRRDKLVSDRGELGPGGVRDDDRRAVAPAASHRRRLRRRDDDHPPPAGDLTSDELAVPRVFRGSGLVFSNPFPCPHCGNGE